ncbi:MAG: hypothetical protein KAU35_02385 [candidate division Zixibacteria bacterium]|nr:hypothetical protein [candidate division Zixibacteria bacterium]
MKVTSISKLVMIAGTLIVLAALPRQVRAACDWVYHFDCDWEYVITWSALITDSLGDPVAPGLYSLSYCYYEDSVDSDCEIVCCGGRGDLPVAGGGLATAQLAYPIPIHEDTVKQGDIHRGLPGLWLEITFDGEVIGPRTRVTPVPNASVSQRVTGDIRTMAGLMYLPDSTGRPAIELRVDSSGTRLEMAAADSYLRSQITTSGLYLADSATGNISASLTSEGVVLTDGASSGYVLTTDSEGLGTWQPVAGGDDGDWCLTGNVLRICNGWGIARYGAVLHGFSDYTHVNLGVEGVTGSAGQGYRCATVGGGWLNTAGYDYSVVSGGRSNTAGEEYSTISGGRANSASSSYSGVAGGYSNTAGGHGSAVAGGVMNEAHYSFNVIGGGLSNATNGKASTISGGEADTAYGIYAGVASGYSNLAGATVFDTAALVCGGYDNTAGSKFSSVLGGRENYNQGNYSTILGGSENSIVSPAHHSLVFGDNVMVENSYRVVFFNSDNSGRVGINRDDEDYLLYPLHIGTNTSNGNGAFLSGGGTWISGSSREFKEDFRSLDGADVLERIGRLPIENWRYKGTDERHIWPVAEDFHAAFDVGVMKDGQRDTKYLAAADVAGVALKAVQTLYQTQQKLQAKTDEIDELRAELKDTRAQLTQVTALVEVIMARQRAPIDSNDELAATR